MIDDTILTKVPFTRITPRGYLRGQTINDLKPMRVRTDRMNYKVVSQSDFLREYFPSGHMINSEEYYPDRIKYDEENKRFFKESVFRAAFPFQMIITIQHLVHLFGNDVRHELTDGKMDEKVNELFLEFQKGWLDHNIDIALYEMGKSVKITGDGALVFYLLDGKVYTKTLSFLEGDTLYPHYDTVTGKLDMFARQFVDYDAEAKERVVWVEVWDKEYMYTYRQDKQGLAGAFNRVKEFFGLSGYSLVGSPKRHGFSRIPVVYHRDPNGACWSFSQDSIDKYELAISHLCQNNMAYAFPIMLLKGDDVEIQGDMYGAVKAITMGKEDDASFMARPQASEEFNLQLTTLLKMIFMGSFIVMPPEVKSGDLPGVAIKLIYSPSLEKAMIDAKDFDHVVDETKTLFQEGYGVEVGKVSRFASLNILSYIIPYIHQNSAELVQNLVSCVGAGILSKQSASDQTGYDKNAEWDRIMKEHKAEQEADLLYQIKTTQNSQSNKQEEGSNQSQQSNPKNE